MAIVDKKDAKADVKKPVVDAVAVEGRGEKADTLGIVSTIQDPSKPDKEGDRVTGKIIGYVMVSSEAIEVPDLGTTPAFSHKNPMDFNIEQKNKTRKVKANEEFKLTPMEAAVLISRKEYDGSAKMGEYPVTARYLPPSTKGAGAAATKGATPRVSLGLATKGTIKDVPHVECLAFTQDTVNGRVKKTRTLNAGFENWEPLTVAKQSTRVAGTRTAKKSFNKKAEQFNKFFENLK